MSFTYTARRENSGRIDSCTSMCESSFRLRFLEITFDGQFTWPKYSTLRVIHTWCFICRHQCCTRAAVNSCLVNYCMMCTFRVMIRPIFYLIWMTLKSSANISIFFNHSSNKRQPGCLLFWVPLNDMQIHCMKVQFSSVNGTVDCRGSSGLRLHTAICRQHQKLPWIVVNGCGLSLTVVPHDPLSLILVEALTCKWRCCELYKCKSG